MYAVGADCIHLFVRVAWATKELRILAPRVVPRGSCWPVRVHAVDQSSRIRWGVALRANEPSRICQDRCKISSDSLNGADPHVILAVLRSK